MVFNLRSMKVSFFYLFGFFMMLVYWGMAFCLLFTTLFVDRIAPSWRYMIGIVFFAYGVWRFVRQLRSRKYS